MKFLLFLLAPMMGHAALRVYGDHEPRGFFAALETDPCLNNSTCYDMVKLAVDVTLKSGDYLPTRAPTPAPTSSPTPAPKGNKGGGKMLRGRQLMSCDCCYPMYGYWTCVTFFSCTQNRRDMLSLALAGTTETETKAIIEDSCWMDNTKLTPYFSNSVKSKLPADDIFGGITFKLQEYHPNCDLLF